MNYLDTYSLASQLKCVLRLEIGILLGYKFLLSPWKILVENEAHICEEFLNKRLKLSYFRCQMWERLVSGLETVTSDT